MSVRERRNRKDRRGKTPEQIQRDYQRHERAYNAATQSPGYLMAVRTHHFSSWGSGHTHSGPVHVGPCVCQCGITQPYDGDSQ